MKYEEKSKGQLLDELAQLRRKASRLDEKITESELAEKTAGDRKEQLESEIKVLLSTDSEVGAEEPAECIDIGAIQDLMDSFYKVKSIPFAMVESQRKHPRCYRLARYLYEVPPRSPRSLQEMRRERFISFGKCGAGKIHSVQMQEQHVGRGNADHRRKQAYRQSFHRTVFLRRRSS